jgi:phosphomannomutase
MPDPLITVSGLRGVVGESFTPSIITRYIGAFAAGLPAGRVLVARDGRATGAMAVDAVRAAIAAAGLTPLDAGVAATPTVGVLVGVERCVGAVQVSASHNPAEYNGLKLFGGDGRILPAAEGEQVRARYLAGEVKTVAHDAVGHAAALNDSVTAHLERVLKVVDIDRIRSRAFRVVLDSNHGSGAVLGRTLLERLGCAVAVLGERPDGQFAHPPEPTAENLADIASRVADARADACFCQDPDADRLAIIDSAGRYLGEELTLALCVDHRLRQNPGPVVSNCSSSRVTQDIAERYGQPFVRSAVGEANVVDAMLGSGAVLGGEGAGGVIHPDVVFVRDSFVGMAMVLDAMAARGKSVAELADELPSYAIHKTKVTLPAERVAAGLELLERHFAGAKVSRQDGLRLDWPDERKWLLIRASNTEPIVRLVAEAPAARDAVAICEAAGGVLSASSSPPGGD